MAQPDIREQKTGILRMLESVVDLVRRLDIGGEAGLGEDTIVQDISGLAEKYTIVDNVRNALGIIREAIWDPDDDQMLLGFMDGQPQSQANREKTARGVYDSCVNTPLGKLISHATWKTLVTGMLDRLTYKRNIVIMDILEIALNLSTVVIDPLNIKDLPGNVQQEMSVIEASQKPEKVDTIAVEHKWTVCYGSDTDAATGKIQSGMGTDHGTLKKAMPLVSNNGKMKLFKKGNLYFAVYGNFVGNIKSTRITYNEIRTYMADETICVKVDAQSTVEFTFILSNSLEIKFNGSTTEFNSLMSAD